MAINTQAYRKQQGMTLVSWLLLMALIGFLALIVLKMFPIYSNHYKIKGVLTSLEEERDLYSLDRQQLLSIMDRKLHINMVNSFKMSLMNIRNRAILFSNEKKEGKKPEFNQSEFCYPLVAYLQKTEKSMVELSQLIDLIQKRLLQEFQLLRDSQFFLHL